MRAGIGVWVFVGCFLFGFWFGGVGFEGFVLVVLLFWGLGFFWLVWLFWLVFLQRRKL